MSGDPKLRSRLGLAGVVGFIAFTTAWITSSFFQEDYSVRREEISGLASQTAEVAWLMIAGFVIMGAGTVLLGLGLRFEFGGSLRQRIGPGLIMLAGAGILLAGVFRNDCSSLHEACEPLVEADEVSWQHYAHDGFGIIAFLALIAAPLVMAGRFRADPDWASLRLPSLVLTPVLIVLLVLYASEAFPGVAGIIQRAFILLATGWVGVAGARLYVTSRAPPEGRGPPLRS